MTFNGRRIYLHHFVIKPEFQNRGLGTKLGRACLAFAKEKNTQIKLEMHHSNDAAIRLYEKLGFQVLVGYVVMINRDPG